MNDAFLYYNVADWSKYGLAVPNYGNDTQTQNNVILDFVHTAGRNLQAIMWHTDSRLRTPPSINTLTRIHKLCIRSRSLFSGAAVPAGKPNMESQHAMPAPETFRVFPVPYFEVRNSWMKNYCHLILLALTEAIQHNENAKPLEISQDFAGQIGQYMQRVYRMLATDLFQVPLERADAPNFTLTEQDLASYNPAVWFTSTEMIDTVPSLSDWPTEDTLRVLTDGIPVSLLPELGRYPASPEKSSKSEATAGSFWPASPKP